jgi:Fic family protein
VPNPGLLARPAIRQEAVSTSALEGTYAALDDVLEADFLNRDQLTASVSEVHNYVEAAELAFEWIKDKPITIGMLEQLQKMLVRGTRGGSHDAGRIRTTQVFIGAGGGRVEDARFVPSPPGDQLRAGIEAWASWLMAEDTIPLVIKMALGHYQFETLHPFNDGNGRLGRLVCVLQLAHRGELLLPGCEHSDQAHRPVGHFGGTHGPKVRARFRGTKGLEHHQHRLSLEPAATQGDGGKGQQPPRSLRGHGCEVYADGLC